MVELEEWKEGRYIFLLCLRVLISVAGRLTTWLTLLPVDAVVCPAWMMRFVFIETLLYPCFNHGAVHSTQALERGIILEFHCMQRVA